jgi:hypothetical protein
VFQPARTTTDLFSVPAPNLFAVPVLGAGGERSGVKIPIFTAVSEPAGKTSYHRRSITGTGGENEVISAGPCYGLAVKMNYHCWPVLRTAVKIGLGAGRR